MTSWILLTALAVPVLLLFEWLDVRPGAAVAKMAASSGFVGVAVTAGAPQAGPFGWLMLAALALCWIGDACLIPRGARMAFLAGLGAFLAGHVVFALAFVVRGVDWEWAAASGVVLAFVALAVAGALLPTVPDAMRRPILAYMAAISAMLSLAVGSWAAEGGALLPLAALAFYASDLTVARDRFLAPGLPNRLVGLPLYYAAQVAFAVLAGA